MRKARKTFLRSGLTVAAFALAAAAAGCATTQRVRVSDQNYCPFLGSTVCAQLTTTAAPGRLSAADVAGGGQAEADLHYFNPDAQWTQYSKVMIAPVTFWAGDDTKVSAKDQHELTNYFYQALQQQLAKKFTVVDQPGPGVLTIQVALDDATTTTPVLRSISMLIPQARALASLKYLATGTYTFVGSAQAEAKVADSVSGQVLWAGVSKRVGGGSLKTAAQWELGDAENAITYWATQMSTKLSSWTSGTARS